MVDYLTDLESTCSALGTNDGAGSYHKDDDCIECVKDLIRFLRRDDGNNHTLRRALGEIGVVKSDLLPILREYSSDEDLFDMVLRLVVNLSSPELLLFRQELPEDKITRNYFLQLQRFRQGLFCLRYFFGMWVPRNKSHGRPDWLVSASGFEPMLPNRVVGTRS